jgi:hypothetical protein
MVADTVALYRGTLRIENKPGGGLAVTARFPQVTA